MNPRNTQQNGPFSDPMALMRMLKSDDGIESLMQEPIFPTEDGGKVSQAEILADVINIYRMDAKKFGELHGVDISITRITPDKVAWMLSEMVNGDPGAMIDTFNEIEDLHHETFEEVLDDEAFDEYTEMKKSVLFSQNAEMRDAYRGDEEGDDA